MRNALFPVTMGCICLSPAAPDENWEIEKLVDEAASDAVLVDLDGDGEKEQISISPFHGSNLYL